MSTLEELADLFEQTGLPASAALELAQEIANHVSDVRPGVVFAGTHAAVVPAMWQRARGSGTQSLTLKLEIDDDGYHTRITVLERTERSGLDRAG